MKKNLKNVLAEWMKCHWNVNFEQIDTEPSGKKMMDFDYCEEYLRSISNKILLWQCSEKQILIQLTLIEW